MKLQLYILLILSTICFTSCHDEGTTINYDTDLPEPTEPELEDNPRDTLNLTNRETVYQLMEFEDSGISGLARFIEIADGGFLAVIEIQAGVEDDVIPFIESGHYREGGDSSKVLLTLNPVDPETGVSETIVTELNNGEPITYLESRDINGHLQVNVNKEPVAVADIGVQFFVTRETIALNPIDFPDITGSITFNVRRTRAAEVVIEMKGLEDGQYPAYFYNNESDVLLTFNPVDGETGESVTLINSFDDGSSFDGKFFVQGINAGYLQVHDTDNFSKILGRTVFGLFTGGVESSSYTLQEQNDSGVQAYFTYIGNINSFTNTVGPPNAIVRLHHSADYPNPYAEIRSGRIGGRGGVALTISNFEEIDALEKFGVVKEGKLTSVSELDNGDKISYDELTSLSSHILVYSDSTKTEVIAQANLNN